MINSILDRHTDYISFDNIKTENDLITDPKLIKNHIKNHFDNWTNHHAIDEQIFNNTWKNCYKTNTSINPQHYRETLKIITSEEVLFTLQQLPNNKACSSSGISYEMLKHAGNNFLQAITNLLNRCLELQQIPKQWKEGIIFPISKKPTFDGNLNNTRPISLIEHIKKLYTKILTNHLNLALTSKQILSPFNYIALPGNSTSIPIHILNNIIEDSYCNSEQLWLLSQDMSKAYDSVNANLLKKAF